MSGQSAGYYRPRKEFFSGGMQAGTDSGEEFF
ncbi:hypothetical protein RCH17_003835 [Arthrobacter sp. MP_M7]|nr:hypothetical protein [Arthrobacter sp. MP_M4]MEC5205003.1 hypothetical protein [Arthrobacter sp. MP_M7]